MKLCPHRHTCHMACGSQLWWCNCQSPTDWLNVTKDDCTVCKSFVYTMVSGGGGGLKLPFDDLLPVIKGSICFFPQLLHVELYCESGVWSNLHTHSHYSETVTGLSIPQPDRQIWSITARLHRWILLDQNMMAYYVPFNRCQPLYVTSSQVIHGDLTTTYLDFFFYQLLKSMLPF